MKIEQIDFKIKTFFYKKLSVAYDLISALYKPNLNTRNKKKFSLKKSKIAQSR